MANPPLVDEADDEWVPPHLANAPSAPQNPIDQQQDESLEEAVENLAVQDEEDGYLYDEEDEDDDWDWDLDDEGRLVKQGGHQPNRQVGNQAPSNLNKFQPSDKVMHRYEGKIVLEKYHGPSNLSGSSISAVNNHKKAEKDR